jgi:hypothetical protein
LFDAGIRLDEKTKSTYIVDNKGSGRKKISEARVFEAT